MNNWFRSGTVERLQIVEFIENNNFFDPKEHVSRTGHSTVSHMLEDQDDILKVLVS